MRYNFFYRLIIFSSCCVLAVLLVCCNDPQLSERKQKEQLQNKRIRDSLVATGKHGYYADYFIIGRIQSVQVFKATPFEVKAMKINSELLGKGININILDSAKYSIAYFTNKHEIVLSGVFGKLLECADIQIVISKTDDLINSKNPESYKKIQYAFEVHEY